jgi:hypothetical protein
MHSNDLTILERREFDWKPGRNDQMNSAHCLRVYARILFGGRASAVWATAAMVCAAYLSGPLYGQGPWTGGPTGPIYYTGGNVGIGTTSPQAKLYIAGGSNGGLETTGNATYGGSLVLNDYSTSLNANMGIEFKTRSDSNGFGWRISSLANNTDLVFESRAASATWGEKIRFINNGNTGIGTASPLERLDLGNGALGFTVPQSPGTDVTYPKLYYAGDVGNGNSGLVLRGWNLGIKTGNFNDTTTKMMITNSGNVGIGTTAPQSLLAVNGTITTKEVVVTNTGWSDYVFAPDYHLQPLNEVGAYVKEHHHLPEIPSEAEVKEKGVSLGDMQAKLLAKVEELTLHMIQADERNTRLEQQNRELRDRVARLETRNPGQGPEKEQ